MTVWMGRKVQDSRRSAELHNLIWCTLLWQCYSKMLKLKHYNVGSKIILSFERKIKARILTFLTVDAEVYKNELIIPKINKYQTCYPRTYSRCFCRQHTWSGNKIKLKWKVCAESARESSVKNHDSQHLVQKYVHQLQ